MAAVRNLAHPPIREAVLDLRLRTSTSLDVSNLRNFPGDMDFEPGVEMKQFQFGFGTSGGKPVTQPTVDQGIMGYLFKSLDGKRVLQRRKDGFTFSLLAPYSNWGLFSAEALDLFGKYLKQAAVESVDRIALRYVNLIPIPEGSVGDFSGFLTAPPVIAPAVDLFLTNFLTRVEVQEPDTPSQAVITQTIQRPATHPGYISVLLDIDAFQVGPFSPTVERVSGCLEVLRHFKNHLFFESVTDLALETADQVPIR